jgi:tetratricopeptide (TPR) repeat protein
MIAEQSLGDPFLIDQYARYHAADEGEAFPTVNAIDLHSLMRRRIARLAPSARKLLHLSAVAVRPVPEAVMKDAAGISDYADAIDALSCGGLLRVIDVRGRRELSCFHDKIREFIIADIGEAERQVIHAQLANSFMARRNEDPIVMTYLAGAGRKEEASALAIQSGDRAMGQLAFDSAAELYRTALAIAEDNQSQPVIRMKLANAYASAGRGVKAATEFVAAAEQSTDEYERVDCLRQAAEQYMRVGPIQEAFSVLRKLAQSVGIRLVRTNWMAIVLLIWRRLLLRFRRIEIHHQSQEVSRRQVMKLDIQWSLVTGFAAVNPILGSAFHAQHLLLALRIREPHHLAMSLALEAGYASLGGERQLRYAEKVSQMARSIAVRLNSPRVLGFSAVNTALCCEMRGHWRMAVDHASKAEILRNQCTGAHWELTTARIFLFTNLAMLGEIHELSARFSDAMRDARDRGDVYAATALRVMTNSLPVQLAADQPDLARLEWEEAVKQWEALTGGGFDMPHLFAVMSIDQIFMYKNDYRSAWQHLEKNWDEIRKLLFILRSDFFSTFFAFHRGQVAASVASLSDLSERKRLIAIVRRCEKEVRRYPASFAVGLSSLLQSCLADAQGDRGRCLEFLADAQASFEVAEMTGYGACVQWVRGVRTADGGRQLIQAAEAVMRAQGVIRPDLFSQALVFGPSPKDGAEM